MRFFRKKGISLLVPTQNVEQTVELCLRSFKDFSDEMIVVDNGSTDNTIDIVRSLEGEIPNMQFYEAPNLKDLYENRQYAFEKSQYEWIVRIDSDYIAYTSGKHDIKQLREKILKTKKSIKPIAYGITQVNLFPDYFHTGPEKEQRNNFPGISNHIKTPTNHLAARIIQWYPGMKFIRRGRWEGVRWQNHLKHVLIKEPYWFHCTLKTKIDWLIRFERNNWRKLGDFKKYPTREIYIKEAIQKKYGITDFAIAAERHWQENVTPFLIKYSEIEYYPYPEIIEKELKKNSNSEQ